MTRATRRARFLDHNLGDQRPSRVPRKMKRAVQHWMDAPPGWQFRHRRERARVLRWIQSQRTRNGMGPLRRLPDGRVSVFDLV